MKFRRITQTLGRILQIYALFLLLPILASLYWDTGEPSDLAAELGLDMRHTTVGFLLSFLFIYFLGLLLSLISRAELEDLREREGYFVVGFGWLLCAALGSLPFVLTGATRDPTVAWFESMSAITTTGFSALIDPTDPLSLERLPPSIHIWRGTLHFFGGLGIVLVAVAILSRLTEGAVKLIGSETAGGDVTRLRPKLTQTAKSLFSVYIVLTLLVFLAFWLSIRYTADGYSWKLAGFHALVHAFGTVATGGMSSLTSSVAGFASPWVSWVMVVGMFLSGVSFPLYYLAVHMGFGRLFRNPEFRFFVTLVVLASVAVFTFLLREGSSFAAALSSSIFTVITTLTCTGYTDANPDLFPDGAKLILVFLMFTGAMVGSTTGAIKLGRIYLLLVLTYRELQKLLHPHAISVVKMGGRIFPEETLRRVIVFFFSYVSVFIAGAVGFSALGFDLQSSISASASSLGNVGYGFGIVAPGFGPQVTETARLLGTLLMWVGRLEIFTALLILVPATYRN